MSSLDLDAFVQYVGLKFVGWYLAGAPGFLALLLDPNLYLNDLTFDEAVGVLVNVLLIMERLYVRNQKRAEEQDGKHCSLLFGLQTLTWQSDSRNSYVGAFNQTTDRVISAQSTVKMRKGCLKMEQGQNSFAAILSHS